MVTGNMDIPKDSAPYVVSEDIYTLLRNWARVAGFVAPEKAFVATLRDAFRSHLTQIFSEVIMLPEDDLRHAARRLIADSTLPVINLDGVYCENGAMLQLCRANKADMSSGGIVNRPGTPAFEEQLLALKKAIQGDVILFDDVIFSGALIGSVVIPRLREIGIFVREVYACVGIQKGIDRVRTETELVRCAYSYADVVDQICERDFYPGVQYSGRLYADEYNVGMPYVAPFGYPGKWASIPEEHVAELSRLCIDQSIRLFEEIERCSRRVVRCMDLPRHVRLLPNGGERFVDALKIIR